MYKVKMMKMLWYVGALSYQRRGWSITGLVYQHMPYGALPIAHADIINLSQLEVEEIEKVDMVIYDIQTRKGIPVNVLEQTKIDITYKVACRFKDTKAEELVNYMYGDEALSIFC